MGRPVIVQRGVTSAKRLADYTQASTDRLEYQIDYSRWLSIGETISTFTFTIEDASTPPLVVDGTSKDSTNSLLTYFVSGGVSGAKYAIAVAITTSASQALECYVAMRVKDPSATIVGNSPATSSLVDRIAAEVDGLNANVEDAADSATAAAASAASVAAINTAIGGITAAVAAAATDATSAAASAASAGTHDTNSAASATAAAGSATSAAASAAIAAAVASGVPFVVVTWPPYNAVGDGVTDNTAVYAAAVAALPKGGTVITPTGKFYCAGGVNDGTNSAAILFQGVGHGSDHINSPAAYDFSTGSCILVGTNDVSAVTFNNLYGSIDKMNIEGCNSITATTAAVQINASSGGNIISASRIKFGFNAINAAQLFFMEQTVAVFGYGDCAVKCPTSIYASECTFDHTSHVLGQFFPPAFNTVVPAWAASTSAVANTTIVSIGGFWVQCSVSGTTGSTVPTVLPYGQSMLDHAGGGTAQWKLLIPADYCALIANSLVLRACDMVGPYPTAAIKLTDTSGNNHLSDTNIQAWNTGILANDGSGLTVHGCNITTNITPTGASIVFASGWGGRTSVVGCTLNAPNGIIVNGGQGYTFDDNQISANGFSGTLKGISIAAGILHFTITNNHIGTSLASDTTLTDGIVVAAGASDHYTIDGNHINATTPISDGGTGTDKDVQSGAGPTTIPQLAVRLSAAFERVVSASVAPTGTTSLNPTHVMMGIGLAFTPKSTGNFIFSLHGTGTNSVAGSGFNARLRYGTGTPPTNGAAEAGTLVAGSTSAGDVGAANDVSNANSFAFVSDLTVGTTYWLDISLSARTSGIAALNPALLTALEI